MWHGRLVVALVAAISLLGTSVASGQAAAPQRAWDVEFHAGGMLSTNPTNGTTALPAPGPAITTFSGAATRRVSSWYFGDGAALLNQALASIRVGGPLTSLDPVLESAFVRRRSGGSIGFRVERVLTPRLSAEFAVDDNFGSLALRGDSASGIEATRASFAPTWNRILNVPATGGTQTVSSAATVSNRQGRQLLTTGTLLISLNTAGRARFFAALGPAVIVTLGPSPTVTLVGDYQFSLAGVTPPPPLPLVGFHETDTVTVRSSVKNALAGVLGGGLKLALSDRWGLRVEVRDYVNRSTASTLTDATPIPAALATPTSGVLSTVLMLSTNPALQFSTRSDVPSNLSGPIITGFKTFSGTGIESHLNITAGLFYRF